MAKPINPFDQEAIDAYLKEKADKAGGVAAPPEPRAPEPADEPAPSLEVPDDDPSLEAMAMLEYWAGRGADVYAAAIKAIADEVTASAAGLEQANVDDVPVDGLDEAALDPDAIYEAAALGYAMRDAGNRLYTAARTALWRYVDRTPGKNYVTPGGATFTFKAGAKSRRSTDYKVLEADYPAAYHAAVKVTATDPEAPGTLNL